MSYDITVPRYSLAIKDSRQALYWNFENLEPEKFFSQDTYFFFPNYNCSLFFRISYIYTVKYDPTSFPPSSSFICPQNVLLISCCL